MLSAYFSLPNKIQTFVFIVHVSATHIYKNRFGVESFQFRIKRYEENVTQPNWSKIIQFVHTQIRLEYLLITQ